LFRRRDGHALPRRGQKQRPRPLAGRSPTRPKRCALPSVQWGITVLSPATAGNPGQSRIRAGNCLPGNEATCAEGPWMESTLKQRSRHVPPKTQHQNRRRLPSPRAVACPGLDQGPPHGPCPNDTTWGSRPPRKAGNFESGQSVGSSPPILRDGQEPWRQLARRKPARRLPRYGRRLFPRKWYTMKHSPEPPPLPRRCRIIYNPVNGPPRPGRPEAIIHAFRITSTKRPGPCGALRNRPPAPHNVT